MLLVMSRKRLRRGCLKCIWVLPLELAKPTECSRKRANCAPRGATLCWVLSKPMAAALISDLEVIPPRDISYRGVLLKELDVDAILARRPEFAIVDELPHTNVPGSRNHKSYQDVQQLLAAGINVITALNIQHVESLAPIVK